MKPQHAVLYSAVALSYALGEALFDQKHLKFRFQFFGGVRYQNRYGHIEQ